MSACFVLVILVIETGGYKLFTLGCLCRGETEQIRGIQFEKVGCNSIKIYTGYGLASLID